MSSGADDCGPTSAISPGRSKQRPSRQAWLERYRSSEPFVFSHIFARSARTSRKSFGPLSNRRSPFPQHRRQQWRSCRSATRNGWPHITDGYGAETARAQTCGFRAFVGNASMDFSLSALRFIVAVSSFFGFNVRVLDSLMKAPSNSPTLDNEAELHGCGV